MKRFYGRYQDVIQTLAHSSWILSTFSMFYWSCPLFILMGVKLFTCSCWFVLECHYLFSGVQLRTRPVLYTVPYSAVLTKIFLFWLQITLLNQAKPFCKVVSATCSTQLYWLTITLSGQSCTCLEKTKTEKMMILQILKTAKLKTLKTLKTGKFRFKFLIFRAYRQVVCHQD